MSITQLQKGAEAVIKAVSGPDDIRHQLQELGFTPGSRISLVAQGPFRGPKAFSIRGTTIALREEEAACVHI